MAKLWKRKKKNGDFVYMVDFYFHGKRIQKSTRTKDKKTAEMILKDIDARIAKGAFSIETVKPKKKVFLKQFKAEFLEYSKNRKAEKTYIRDELVFRTFLEAVGERALSSITTKVIEDYLIKRSKRLKASSVNIDLRHLKAAFTKAVDWGYVEKNPVKGIKPLVVPERAPNFFTEVELKDILEKLPDQFFRDMVLFSARTGVRIGELVNIAWDDIDFTTMTVHITNKEDFKTKSRKERVIPMNNTVYEILAGMERNSEYVFASHRGTKREMSFIRRTFRDALDKAKIPKGYSFHSLRHTFASHLVQKGVSIYVVSKLLGHASPKTTEVYAHLSPEKHHEVVELLDPVTTKDASQEEEREKKEVPFVIP